MGDGDRASVGSMAARNAQLPELTRQSTRACECMSSRLQRLFDFADLTRARRRGDLLLQEFIRQAVRCRKG
jgi:hypothetical protein